MATEKIKNNLYPTIEIKNIIHPNRWYAFPILGGVVKIIILIPVFIFIAVLGIADFFVLLINSFYVLFTGTYWQVAYNLTYNIMRLGVKTTFFLNGLTNKYPGFSFTIDDAFSIDVIYPKKPNKLFAFPLLGGLARIVLLIPFFIYVHIISYAASIATTIIASIIVLCTGKYPEYTFELNRDSVRLTQAAVMYLVGLSDTYPSFWISLNHKKIKIALIIIATLLSIINYSSKTPTSKPQVKNTYKAAPANSSVQY